MAIKEELMKVYKETKYILYPDDSIEEVEIRIDKTNREIDSLLDLLDEDMLLGWAFISASNPFSVETSVEENKQSFKRLEELVAANYMKYYTGFGKGQNGWPDEKSIFIIGISEKEATELGKELGQNAIIIGAKGSKAKIKWVQD
jgi:hypothetical protein